MTDVVKMFGSMVERRLKKSPEDARNLLLTGYAAQQWKLSHLPKKELPPSEQYAAVLAMDLVRKALNHPDDAAMVSMFVPCEPLTAAGVTPFSVETLSCFLAGTKCNAPLLEHAATCGMPETMCSYHRTFLGASQAGLMPRPRFMVYTNVACDGNLVTFPYLRDKLSLPCYFVDVPFERSEEAVEYVARQLQEMTTFMGEVSLRKVDEDSLKQAVARSKRTMELYRKYCEITDRTLPCDLTHEMYLVLMSHMLLGTNEALHLFEMLLADKRAQSPDGAKRLLWMHLMPNMQPSLRTILNHTGRAGIATCELVYDNLVEMDPGKPYESMARRMVYSPYNATASDRIARALEMARLTKADGVVLFAHWGCTGTTGMTHLAKTAFEDAGYPTLVLEGDGCNVANTNDGQTATRLEAYLELLEGHGPQAVAEAAG